MTAGLLEALTALYNACPAAAVLISEPDREGRAAVTLPPKTSRPPWNPAAASAAIDPQIGIRQIHAEYHEAITTRQLRYVSTATRATGAHITAITDLALIDNRPHDSAWYSTDEYARRVTSWVTAIQQLPAIDVEERAQRVKDAECFHCHVPMLRLFPKSGRVTCVRFGACYDCRGEHPAGFVRRGLDGEPLVEWADGCLQYGTAVST